MSRSQAQTLDTVRRIETPEGVVLELRAAGPVARGAAWMVDLLIRCTIYFMAAILLSILPLGNTGAGIYMIILFVTEWFYPVLFEVYRDGRTPGKSAMKLAVVHDDGTPVGWTAAVLRNMLRFADLLPLLPIGGVPIPSGLFGLLSMVSNKDFKRLGDMAAGTMVVYRDSLSWVERLPKASPEPVPVPLSIAEQRALVEFAERTEGWTTERAEELAAILKPLLGETGSRAVRRSHGMARWLLGRT